MIPLSNERIDALKKIMKLSEDDQTRHLRYLVKCPIEIRLGLFEKQRELFYPLSQKYKDILVNALGEGGINVCSENGNIEIGDYICTSSIKGKGMKQDDDLLHNYTVAKALEAVDWSKETQTTKMIACTYHAG